MPDADPQQHRSTRSEQVIEAGKLTITSEREGVVHSITLSGELDLATVPRLQDELERVEASDARSIIVDLSGLSFIDSAGIRLIITAEERSRVDSNRLVLLKAPASVQRVFQLTALEDQLPFAD
jgi:anti-sigma B factor antagonist